MKIALTTVSLCAAFIVSPFGKGFEPEKQLSRFLSQQSAPLWESTAHRRMEARNPKGDLVAWLEIRSVVLGGNTLNYSILKEFHVGKSGKKASESFLALLESEKEQVKSGSFKKSGFLLDNYTFTKAENLGGVYQLSLKAKRKEGLLINGMIFVTPEGRLLRSEGLLTKNPSFWISSALVIFSYDEIFGVTLPTSYDSKVRIRFFGEWTFSTKYIYTSINGIPVTKN